MWEAGKSRDTKELSCTDQLEDTDGHPSADTGSGNGLWRGPSKLSTPFHDHGLVQGLVTWSDVTDGPIRKLHSV